MQNWVVYGLIAAFFFGINPIIYKIAQQKGGFSPYFGSFIFGIGIVLIFGMFLLFKPSFQFELKFGWLALVAGMLWGLGFLALAVAIAKGYDVAKLAPIYNTNTIITVVLGIIFLKEIPDASQMFRVITGAVMVVVGAVLVSI